MVLRLEVIYVSDMSSGGALRLLRVAQTGPGCAYSLRFSVQAEAFQRECAELLTKLCGAIVSLPLPIVQRRQSRARESRRARGW